MNAFFLTETSPYELPPTWRLLSTFVYFAALAVAIGGMGTHLFVVRPALRGRRGSAAAAAGDRDTLVLRMHRVLAVAGVILLPACYAMLATTVARSQDGMRYATALTPGELVDFLWL